MSQAIGNPRLAYMRLWHHADASGRVLGKFAARIANVLMGKHKPVWHPSKDYGDYVLVTNVRNLVVTGKKADQKLYRHHTMHPGGLHTRKYRDLMSDQPDQILRFAVSGMLPKNKLRDRRLERLRIFEGDAVEGGLAGNLLTRWGGLTEKREMTFVPQASPAMPSATSPAPLTPGDDTVRYSEIKIEQPSAGASTAGVVGSTDSLPSGSSERRRKRRMRRRESYA